MPHPNLTWQHVRPQDFVTHEVQIPDRQPVRTYLPLGYEPNYPYPLVVLFHPRGGNEYQVLKLAPQFSERNFICISLRGPEMVACRTGTGVGFSWGIDGRFDGLIEDYVFRAVEQTRQLYHTHSERTYLAGLCEGSVQAYRLALAFPERFGGVVALNGSLPDYGRPLFRWPAVQRFRAFIGHGIANSYAPLSSAREDFRLLHAAGLDVQLKTYPSNHRIHQDMFRDVNRWIITAINAE